MDPDPTRAVYVLASLPRDAELTCQHLREIGIASECTASFDDLLELIDKGEMGAVLITEEAVPRHRWPELAVRLANQPPWGDIPVIICARKAQRGLDELLRDNANVTVIETPVRVSTVVTAVRAALRGRQRQYQMRDLLQRLEDADRRKDEFLAMLGHELRNPLAAIQLAVQLKSNAPGSEEDKQLQVMGRQVRTLGRIVDDLLDVSRITLGKIRLDIRDVDLCDVARRCVQALALEARASRLDLTVQTPSRAVLVRGDVVRLEQIVSNLVTNAIKYTPAGGAVAVEVTDGKAPRFVVRDNGIGIDRAILPKVFDLFSQAQQGLDRSRGGLGLGLALVKHLVELHDGRVDVSSPGVDQGSIFTVWLPPVDENDASQTTTERVVAAIREQLHIVVVEDNDDARVMLRDLLESRGQLVDVASDGGAGLAMAIDATPDVMLIDIGLPVLDGYQLAAEIRKAVTKPPLLIAMTGYGHERERALEAGFDVFMVKPIDVFELEAMLASFAES